MPLDPQEKREAKTISDQGLEQATGLTKHQVRMRLSDFNESVKKEQASPAYKAQKSPGLSAEVKTELVTTPREAFVDISPAMAQPSGATGGAGGGGGEGTAMIAIFTVLSGSTLESRKIGFDGTDYGTFDE